MADVNEYSNIYRSIENELGTVNRETIAKYFAGNSEGLDKFNLLYGYEHTCGGDSILTDITINEMRHEGVKNIMQNTGIHRDSAEKIRKIFDDVYGSSKYYGMTNAQLEKHMVEIHDKCMDAVYSKLHK